LSTVCLILRCSYQQSKKIGEEVGLNISDGLKGISAALEPDDQIKKDKKKSK
jgi:hypothetical protein